MYDNDDLNCVSEKFKINDFSEEYKIYFWYFANKIKNVAGFRSLG